MNYIYEKREYSERVERKRDWLRSIRSEYDAVPFSGFREKYMEKNLCELSALLCQISVIL